MAGLIEFRMELRGEYGRERFWRTIVVKSNISFFALHVAIYSAMGWQKYRPYEFSEFSSNPQERLTFPVDMDRTIDQLLRNVHDTAIYTYDVRDVSGKRWIHDITVVQVIPALDAIKTLKSLEPLELEPELIATPKCTAGGMAPIPEGVDGIINYPSFLRYLSDAIRYPKDHRTCSHMMTEIGVADPKEFDPTSVVFKSEEEVYEIYSEPNPN